MIAALVLVVSTACIIALRWRVSAPRPVVRGVVKELIVYPLKSARGVAVQSAALDARGLAFDRLWMVVDENGAFLSQRRTPRLALIQPELPASYDAPLVLRFCGKESATGNLPSISVSVVRETAPAATVVRVWEDRVDAVDQGDAAAAWLQKALGMDGARLVRMADEGIRPCSRKYAPRNSHTGFSDGFPLLLASEASLAELNQRLHARGKPPVPMDRFRPNLVVGDSTGGLPIQWTANPPVKLLPFEEDSWSSIRVNGIAPLGEGCGFDFGVVKPCSRCKIPTIDQRTGVPDGQRSSSPTSRTTGDDDDEGGGPAGAAEPIATMRTFRTGKLLGYAKSGWGGDVFFGQNLVLGSTAGRSPPLDAPYSTDGLPTISVGEIVVATPRRPPGWLARGVQGVDY